MRRLFVVVTLAFAASAWADVAPPDLAGCNGKQVGEACKRDNGADGTCANATCSRNDYSNGPPPKSVDYACVQCVEGKAAPPAEKKNSCGFVPGEVVLALSLLLVRRRR